MDSEIVKLLKATKVTSVSDLNSTVLMRLNKGPLADFLGNIVKLIDSNVSICKAAAGSLDVMKTKVMETQNQLIERQKWDITAVKNTVKTEIKSRAAVVKKNVTQGR